MSGIAFHRLNKVGDEVTALFQLHIHIRKGLFGLLALGHKAVVNPDDDHSQNGDDTENNV